jgi:hypothetical protein
VVFLLSSTRANADVLNVYTFSGDNGLSGSFTLNTSVGFDITTLHGPDPLTTGTSQSPLNQLTGLVNGPGGLFSFGGSNNLLSIITGGLTGFNDWILRAGTPTCSSCSPISSNTVGGLTVTGLNLFLTPNGINFTPNPPTGRPFSDNYAVSFSDGTFSVGALQTLQLVGTTTVPEPSSLVLLAIGLALLLGVFKRLEKGKERMHPLVGQPIRST